MGKDKWHSWKGVKMLSIDSATMHCVSVPSIPARVIPGGGSNAEEMLPSMTPVARERSCLQSAFLCQQEHCDPHTHTSYITARGSV